MKKFLLTVVIFTYCQAGLAESTITDNKSETVLVTATRTAQTADETLSSVTVITQDDIERQNATSLQEVLQSVAGITMASNGGQGTVSSLFLRGTESNHVVVLIDGIKLGSASTGKTAFEFIPVEQIERIEIVRGPRSSLYGSEAIGGVIQIFTKKGDGKTRPAVSLSAGSYDTYKAVASVAGGNEKTNYYLSLSSYDTDGFNACNGDPLLGGCFTIEPDDDGYRYVAGSATAGHKIGNHTKISVNWMRSKGDVRYDGFYNHTKSVTQTEGIKLSHELSANWFLELQVGQSNDRRKEFNNSTFQDFNNTKRNSSSLQNNFLLDNGGELTIGLDYLDDELESDTAYSGTSRVNKGVFTQYIQQINEHNFQVSARYDDNEQFGSHTTGSVAWGVNLSESQRVSMSYGTAFAAPTFDDLYYPCCANPDLEPEESATIEVSYRSQMTKGWWALNLFQTDIEELIVWNSALFMPENIDDVTIRGIELVLQGPLMGWDTQVDISLLEPENASGPNKGKVLIRRAKEAARLVTSKTQGKYNYGATLIFNGKRYEDSANTVEMDSYYTIDLNGGYKIDKDWFLRVSIKNLLDEDYELVKFYNTPGRHYLLTVSYQPAK